MDLMDLNEQVDRDFGRARRRAWMRHMAALLRGRSETRDTSPSFEEARRSRRAFNRVRRGRRIVDLARVVGSVGRSADFDGSFMPIRPSAGERWKRVDLAFHRSVDLPPVALFKLGDTYFVEDGNHRVSVARYHGLRTVEAEVTEFRPAAGPEARAA